MLTLKKVKELVEAPSHAKRTPSPKMLFEEGIVLLRREFDQGSHLTVYNSGYVLFSAGKRNTVFHIHQKVPAHSLCPPEEYLGGVPSSRLHPAGVSSELRHAHISNSRVPRHSLHFYPRRVLRLPR